MARGTQKTPPPGRVNWKLVLGIAALGAMGVSTAVAAYKVRQFVIGDPQFALSRDREDAITIQGLKYTSRSKVQRVFAPDYGHSVYMVPLAERQRRLEAIDWIEKATVSRVWPDRVVVRVQERQPVAFVNLRRGVMLIDAYGKLLEPPSQAQFAFPVLSGGADSFTDEQWAAHVRSFLRVERDLGYLVKEISEIDTADPENIRIITQVDRRALTLLMGDGSYARRYQHFVKTYPEIVKRSPQARIFDLRLDDRITVKE